MDREGAEAVDRPEALQTRDCGPPPLVSGEITDRLAQLDEDARIVVEL
jgi:hypothetical protein